MLDKDRMLERIDQKLSEMDQRRRKRRQQLMSAKALSVAIGASSKMLTTGCPVAMYGIDGIDASLSDATSTDDTFTGDDLGTLYAGPMDASADDTSVDGAVTMYGIETDAGESVDGAVTMYGIETPDAGESFDGTAPRYGIGF